MVSFVKWVCGHFLGCPLEGNLPIAGAKMATGKGMPPVGIAPAWVKGVNGAAHIILDIDAVGKPAAVYGNAFGKGIENGLPRGKAKPANGGFADANRLDASDRLGKGAVPQFRGYYKVFGKNFRVTGNAAGDPSQLVQKSCKACGADASGWLWRA